MTNNFNAETELTRDLGLSLNLDVQLISRADLLDLLAAVTKAVETDTDEATRQLQTLCTAHGAAFSMRTETDAHEDEEPRDQKGNKCQ